jgi:hypothetical protein
MATKLSDAGVAPHVIEKMLNHRMEGVMAVYNRAEYLPERKAGWILWGNVVAAVRREKKAGIAPAQIPGGEVTSGGDF